MSVDTTLIVQDEFTINNYPGDKIPAKLVAN